MILRWLPLLAMPCLAACSTVSDLAGLAVGGTAGAATANPAVGFAVGIGTRAGVDAIGQWVVRTRWRGEQDAIAEAAGSAPLDTPRPWEIRHTIPVGNEHGLFMVTRDIATPLATCREVVFLVEDGAQHRPFTTTICHEEGAWRWAAAEPARERWGYLQHF